MILRETWFASVTRALSTTVDAKASYILFSRSPAQDGPQKHLPYAAAEAQKNSPLQREAQAEALGLFQPYLL